MSDMHWQAFLVDTLAAALADNGIDGFFLDNFDVYYQYPNDKIYQGLCNILLRLDGAHHLPLLINGGDMFVSRVLQNSDAAQYISGVNQENVFTHYDFDQDTYLAQSTEETAYYQEYLQTCAQHGIRVYLLEYAQDDALISRIAAYCGDNGFAFYVSGSIELD